MDRDRYAGQGSSGPGWEGDAPCAPGAALRRRMGSSRPWRLGSCDDSVLGISSCLCQQHAAFTSARDLHETTHRVGSQALSAGRRLCCPSWSRRRWEARSAASSCAFEGPAQGDTRRRPCENDTARGRRLRGGPLHSVSFSVIQTFPARCHSYLVSPHSWAGGGAADRKEGVSGAGAFFRAGRDLQKHPGDAPARHSCSSFWLKPRTPFDVLGLVSHTFRPRQRRALNDFTHLCRGQEGSAGLP